MSATSALLLIVACTRADKVPPAEAAEATRAPAVVAPAAPRDAARESGASPARDLETWLADWPKAWTDPRVVAVLAEDCSFVPVTPQPDRGEQMHPASSRPADLFACNLGYEQSCNPHPCNGPQSSCESGCTGTCQTCGQTCADACSSCKATCRDGACRKACATKCAECRQTCTRTMDRCVTGACNRQHVACTARLRAVWNRNGCKARCAAFVACGDSCATAKDPEACAAGCAARVAPGQKACRAKCEALGDPAAVDACYFACFETAPCATDWCMGGFDG